MEVELTPDQQALMQAAVRSGRYRSPEDAVRDALAHWEEEERIRLKMMAGIDEADADLSAGRCHDYTDATLLQLAEDVKNEGRALRGAKGRRNV